MLKKIKVSLICTVKNEEDTIQDLLNSIANQSRKPDEIIIVDGGSTDKTVQIIREFIKSKNLPIKLIVAPNANIAQGRNIAIRNSKYSIIASTDGGCKLDPNWLRNIIAPFEKSNVDVVSGVYVPWCENEFEETASYLIFPDIKKLDPNKFLPSGRSIAFKKEAWETVEGYPEWLYTAEDTLFDLRLRKIGMKFALARNAIVYWRVRKNIKGIFKQFYNYAKGDGHALLFYRRYLARYAVAIIFFLLAIKFWYNMLFWLFTVFSTLAGLWVIHLRKIKKLSPKKILIALFVALAIETGAFFGYLRGILILIKDRLRRKCSLIFRNKN